MENERSARVPVRAVLYDLGGTLVQYTPEVGRANAAALAQLGVDPAAPEVREALVAAATEVSQAYAARPSFLHRDLFREQFVRAATLLGVEATAAVLDWFEVEHRGGLVEHLRPRPDAEETLRALKDRGIYQAVVSNADDDFLGPNLERHGLGSLLDDWTSSEEAESCKPDPGIYRHALEKAGCTAEQALFVGDSVHHDVGGASAVGMRCVLIDNGLEAAPLSHGLAVAATPDYEVKTLTEVVTIVDELNGW